MNQQQEKPNNPPQTTNNQFSNHPIASKQISTNHQEKSKKKHKTKPRKSTPPSPKKNNSAKKNRVVFFPNSFSAWDFFYFDTEGGWKFQKVFPKWWWKMVIHLFQITGDSSQNESPVSNRLWEETLIGYHVFLGRPPLTKISGQEWPWLISPLKVGLLQFQMA